MRVGFLGGFRVSTTERAISLPEGPQRLLAYVALKPRAVPRAEVSGKLWPDVSDRAASGSLRSCLWRLTRGGRSAIAPSGVALRVADGVAVDLWESRAIAHRLLSDGGCLRAGDVTFDVIALLSADILPEWYDDWALVESEAWRQLRLHALEALARGLVGQGRFGDAAMAAGAAINADPLRESGHAELIRVHLAEGNRSEAMREFDRYRALLRAELNVDPTSLMAELVGASVVTPR